MWRCSTLRPTHFNVFFLQREFEKSLLCKVQLSVKLYFLFFFVLHCHNDVCVERWSIRFCFINLLLTSGVERIEILFSSSMLRCCELFASTVAISFLFAVVMGQLYARAFLVATWVWVMVGNGSPRPLEHNNKCVTNNNNRIYQISVSVLRSALW